MSYSRVAVVTGSNKGIGYGLVEELCSKFNGDVYLTSRNKERGLNAVKNLEAKGLKVNYHQLDITSPQSVAEFKSTMLERYGGIDVLINNAAVLLDASDPKPLAEKVEITMNTNFFSTLTFSKEFLPHIKQDGRVVNLTSMLGIMSLRNCSRDLQKEFKSKEITEEQLVERMREYVRLAKENKLKDSGWPSTPYDISKLAVIVMSKLHANWLQKHQSDKHILLNSCCPGWVQTDMGGTGAPKSLAQGIETPLYLALLPPGTTTPNGELVSEMSVRKWSG